MKIRTIKNKTPIKMSNEIAHKKKQIKKKNLNMEFVLGWPNVPGKGELGKGKCDQNIINKIIKYKREKKLLTLKQVEGGGRMKGWKKEEGRRKEGRMKEGKCKSLSSKPKVSFFFMGNF